MFLLGRFGEITSRPRISAYMPGLEIVSLTITPVKYPQHQYTVVLENDYAMHE
jgi:hypothetical protein